MNQFFKTALVFVAANLGHTVYAQQTKPPSVHAPAKKVFKPRVYLGNSEYRSGVVPVAEFTRLLKQGISSRDSTGKKYKVIGFDFTYAERNLYEDSVGNLMIMPEYYIDNCKGDTVSKYISRAIYEKLKSGDSVFFDHVMVVRYKAKNSDPMPDTAAFAGESMKFMISK